MRSYERICSITTGYTNEGAITRSRQRQLNKLETIQKAQSGMFNFIQVMMEANTEALSDLLLHSLESLQRYLNMILKIDDGNLHSVPNSDIRCLNEYERCSEIAEFNQNLVISRERRNSNQQERLSIAEIADIPTTSYNETGEHKNVAFVG